MGTVVLAGCNYPNCPRADVYGASERDYPVLIASDAISGVQPLHLDESGRMGAVHAPGPLPWPTPCAASAASERHGHGRAGHTLGRIGGPGDRAAVGRRRRRHLVAAPSSVSSIDRAYGDVIGLDGVAVSAALGWLASVMGVLVLSVTAMAIRPSGPKAGHDEGRPLRAGLDVVERVRD